MSDNWNSLEEYVKKLLSYDQPTRTPLSGGTKGEEDVVGINSVSQCKFTADKNISILAKDLERLISSAKLLNKLPLFFNESNAGRTVALLTDHNCTYHTLSLACLLHGLHTLMPIAYNITTLTQLRDVQKEQDRLKKIYTAIKNEVDIRLGEINKYIKVKYDDLTMHDLFENEGDTNGA